MSGEVPADGFCPWCKAFADEACHNPDGSARENHKARHPMPPRVPSTSEGEGT